MRRARHEELRQARSGKAVANDMPLDMGIACLV
jgi:hypothetical protein